MLQVHYDYWNFMQEDHVAAILADQFRDTTVVPNWLIINRIRGLGEATVQCIENRSSSTVYRILPTNELVQVFQDTDIAERFENMEAYFKSPPKDSLLSLL